MPGAGVGAGNVGATVARSIAEKELADVVIVDIADQKAAGVALDILETCPIIGSDSLVIGGSDYSYSANSDVVVITSGVPRKPGMSRDDLLNVNFNIMKAVTEQVVTRRRLAARGGAQCDLTDHGVGDRRGADERRVRGPSRLRRDVDRVHARDGRRGRSQRTGAACRRRRCLRSERARQGVYGASPTRPTGRRACRA